MMNMYKLAKQGQAGNSGINANAITGTILKYSGSVFRTLNSDTWIIDSGASEHLCFNPNSFLFLTQILVPLNISLPNSFKVIITHIGSVSILLGHILNNVLHVPDFKYTSCQFIGFVYNSSMMSHSQTLGVCCRAFQ